MSRSKSNRTPSRSARRLQADLARKLLVRLQKLAVDMFAVYGSEALAMVTPIIEELHPYLEGGDDEEFA